MAENKIVHAGVSVLKGVLIIGLPIPKPDNQDGIPLKNVRQAIQCEICSQTPTVQEIYRTPDGRIHLVCKSISVLPEYRACRSGLTKFQLG